MTLHAQRERTSSKNLETSYTLSCNSIQKLSRVLCACSPSRVYGLSSSVFASVSPLLWGCCAEAGIVEAMVLGMRSGRSGRVGSCCRAGRENWQRGSSYAC